MTFYFYDVSQYIYFIISLINFKDKVAHTNNTKMAKKGKKQAVPALEEDLDRFAGSSDEDEEIMKPPAPSASDQEDLNHDAEEENDSDASGELPDDDDEFPPQDDEYPNYSETNGKEITRYEDDDSDSSSIEEEEDAATKMANAMGRILGTTVDPKKTHTTSVVLAKTVTPLQKLLHKEKEEQKAMKDKRQSNRERNLTALHIPLSIATTNTIELGVGLSISKELEQERLHRRVATRGVVALFNAITQHQRSTNDADTNNVSSKRKAGETSKLTKHGFLDKIKAAAVTKGSNNTKEIEGEKPTDAGDKKEKKSPSWGALKDDYMLNSKKWDEESSDDGSENSDKSDDAKDKDKSKGKQRKKPRFNSKR